MYLERYLNDILPFELLHREIPISILMQKLNFAWSHLLNFHNFRSKFNFQHFSSQLRANIINTCTTFKFIFFLENVFLYFFCNLFFWLFQSSFTSWLPLRLAMAEFKKINQDETGSVFFQPSPYLILKMRLIFYLILYSRVMVIEQLWR